MMIYIYVCVCVCVCVCKCLKNGQWEGSVLQRKSFILPIPESWNHPDKESPFKFSEFNAWKN